MAFNIFARKRRALDRIDFATIIGEYAVYQGELVGEENCLVHGRVEGTCDLQGHLMLGPTAHWNGDITAAHVVIAGEVIGDVNASDRLELRATARIRGNLMSPVITIAQGAVCDGKIRRRSGAQLVRFQEKRSI